MAKPINPYQGASAPIMARMPEIVKSYTDAVVNAENTKQAGNAALAQGVMSAVSSVAGAYTEHKNDQAKFDATKKMFSAFEDYLPKQTNPDTGEVTSPMGDKIKSLFADTSMSVREKNQMAPMLFSFLGQAQQQSGRESVANIMAGSRVDAANARRPAPQTGSTFGGVPTLENIFNSPANPSQGNPAPGQPTQQQGSPMISADGNSVYDPRKGKWVRLDNNAKTGEIIPDNYYNNSDNLMFDPVTRRIIQQ